MHPRLLKVINERNLVSVMNDTKWYKLADAICADSDLEPFVSVKDIFEESSSGFSLLDWSFSDYSPSTIEWVEFDPIKRQRLGKLIPDKESNVSEYIELALRKSGVAFSYHGSYFKVWGYYAAGETPAFV